MCERDGLRNSQCEDGDPNVWVADRCTELAVSLNGDYMHRLFAKMLVFVGCLSVAFAQETKTQSASSLPGPEVPIDLKPYAQQSDVLAAAEAVLHILKTAKFQKASYGDGQDQPPCDSLNRGMMLAHAGFNMFVNARERGWISPTSVLGSSQDLGLLSERRANLLRIWDAAKLMELLQLRETLTAWPEEIRHDVSTFLVELLNFKTTHREMRLRFSERLKEIQRRSTDNYALDYWVWRRVENVPDKGEKLDEFHRRRPEPLGYEEYSGALFQLVKEIPGQSREILNCLKRTSGALITFEGSVAGFDNGYSYPAKYMFTFWERRDREGLGTMAEYVLNQVIQALR